jgi:catechol 2,3-dioxygenase-like lactoylglutathione lyase family enzyme
MGFRVEQIDHVELCVPDRRTAAGWYRDVLGLEIIPEFEHWAEDPRGPLMIGTELGDTKLALFEGQPTGSQETVGFHLVAFRVSAESFAQFVADLGRLQLKDKHGRIVDPALVSDHGMAYSVYFCDPYGHQLEITTYEYDEAKVALNAT